MNSCAVSKGFDDAVTQYNSFVSMYSTSFDHICPRSIIIKGNKIQSNTATAPRERERESEQKKLETLHTPRKYTNFANNFIHSF